jgi:hypothetical protein
VSVRCLGQMFLFVFLVTSFLVVLELVISNAVHLCEPIIFGGRVAPATFCGTQRGFSVWAWIWVDVAQPCLDTHRNFQPWKVRSNQLS